MAAVFISHSSDDNAVTRSLFDWLQAQGFEKVFLDFDEAHGIPAGSRWEATLYEQLQRCQAVLLLLTPNWLASKWCFAEFVSARAAGKAIFPLRLADCETRGLAAELQHIDLLTDREGGLRRLAAELVRVALFAQGGFDWDRRRVPYPGLAAFEADDAAVYFGRDPEIHSLIERLESRRVQGGARVVALLGASGSGKSSLVRAGVLPRLSRDRARWCVLPPFRPRTDPLRELARVLAIAQRDAGAWPACLQRLQAVATPLQAEAWVADVQAQAAPEAPEACLLITVDQAEELFTTSSPEAGAAFMALLGALARSRAPALVLLTMRSDLFGQWQSTSPAPPATEIVSLPPPPLERLSEIIEGPGRVAGFGVGPGLAAAIAADAVGRDALPLVAFSLRELYMATVGQEATRATAITVQDYARLGDAAAGLSPLQLAVRRRADQVLAGLALDADGLKALRDAFIERLVNLDDEGRYTRRTAAWREFDARAARSLEAFVDARLLVSRLEGEERVVEVAHESLLRHWPALQGWLAEETDFLAGRRQLELAAAQWQRAAPAERQGALLQGLLLQRAADWLARRPSALSDGQRQLVRDSLAQQAAAQARQRRQRVLLAGALLLVLGLAGVLWQAWRSEQVLQRDLQAQRLLRLSAASIEALRADRALVLAAQAHRLNPDARSHAALLQAGLALPPAFESSQNFAPAQPTAEAGTASGAASAPEGAVLQARAGAAPRVMSWGPDGRLLIGDSDGAVHELPADTGAAVRALNRVGPPDKNRPRPVLALQAGPQGGWQALRGDGRWETGASAATATTRWQGPPLEAALFAADGQAAFVLTEAERQWWRVDCTAAAVCRAQALAPAVDGDALVGWDRYRARPVWLSPQGRLSTGDEAAPAVTGAAGLDIGARFTALAALPQAGQWVAADERGRLHHVAAVATDSAPGATRHATDLAPPVAGDGQALTRLSVAPDGRWLAAACGGVRVCLWRIGAAGLQADPLVLGGHAAPVAALAWSADGQLLVSADIGGRIIRWRPAAAAGPAQVLDAAAGAAIGDVAVDPAGRRLAAARADGRWFVWSLPDLRLQHQGGNAAWRDLHSVRWHPSGSWLALASLGGGAVLLRPEAPDQAIGPLDLGPARVESLAIAAEGQAVLAGLHDGSVMRQPIDPASGRPAGPAAALPSSHGEAVLALAVQPAAVPGRAPPAGAALLSSDTLGVVRLHDGGSGARTPPLAEMARVAGAPVGLDALAYAPDAQRWLAAGNHGDVFVFAVEGQPAPARLETGALMITSAAFSPDGALVAAVDDQQRLHLWQGRPPYAAVASVQLRAMPGHLSTDTAAALGGLRRLAWIDAQRLALATQSGHVILLSTSAEAWLQRAQGLGAGATPAAR